jgi:hypothetical protein
MAVAKAAGTARASIVNANQNTNSAATDASEQSAGKALPFSGKHLPHADPNTALQAATGGPKRLA